jgi:hypothetical protein
LFTKKLFSISWVKQFPEGQAIEHQAYVIARTKRGAAKLAKREFSIQNGLAITQTPNSYAISSFNGNISPAVSWALPSPTRRTV